MNPPMMATNASAAYSALLAIESQSALKAALIASPTILAAPKAADSAPEVAGEAPSERDRGAGYPAPAGAPATAGWTVRKELNVVDLGVARVVGGVEGPVETH